jgi:hypothetical protein
LRLCCGTLWFSTVPCVNTSMLQISTEGVRALIMLLGPTVSLTDNEWAA